MSSTKKTQDVRAIIVMGVSGSGKSTIGQALAEELGWAFQDGDDYHPPANIEKMASGKPLTDADRRPWLERLRTLIANHLERGEGLVLASSALKQAYRDILIRGNEGAAIVYLRGSFERISERLADREGHFMPPDLLQSQFDALEEPENAFVCEIERSVEGTVNNIIEHFGLKAR